VLASYGLTEAGSQVATASLDSLVGRFRSDFLPVLPIWEVEIGEAGLIRLRGAALFVGWVETGADGARRFVPRQGEWFETRDSGRLDDAGRRTVTGRADQLVKILGELVDPLVVERALEAVGGGKLRGRVAVVPVRDVRAGHRLVVAVESGAEDGLVELAIAEWHREAPGYSRVSGVVEVEAIPRSPLGKVRRGVLGKIVEKKIATAG
jgi:acyl-CoA synthetase (AMP-forming)/AMP-acid ligase II